MKIKCLKCGTPFDWDDSMFRFCDDCSHTIEETNQDIDVLEKKLLKAETPA